MTLLFLLVSVPQSEDKKSISVTDTPTDTTADASGPIRAPNPEADDSVSQSSVSIVGDRGQPSNPQLQTDRYTEPTSPPKTPSSVSLAESTQSASHSKCVLYLTHISISSVFLSLQIHQVCLLVVSELTDFYLS